MNSSNHQRNTAQGIENLSKKHRVLAVIFSKYYKEKESQPVIPFFLDDIGEAYDRIGEPKPASVSNTILDLVRKDRGIKKRVPPLIADMGYDLRKRTGSDDTGRNYAGEFVYVGMGNQIQSWLNWPEAHRSLVVNTEDLPEIVRKLIRNDEAALFSLIDYFDIFNFALTSRENIYRIQNPMKWQPNEIDGLYVSNSQFAAITLYPVEAKALSTNDDINLDQLQGGYRTVLEKVKELGLENFSIKHLAVMMISNGLKIAVFPANSSPVMPEEVIQVTFSPPIPTWA